MVPDAVVRDSYGREVASGWGAAEIGGNWRTSAPGGSAFVADGVGVLSAPRGTLASASLPVSQQDTDLRLRFGYDQASSGGGIYSQVIGRGTMGTGLGVKVWVPSSGTLYLTPFEKVAWAEKQLSNAVRVRGISVQPKQMFEMRLQTTGTGTSTVRVKVWPVGAEEPEAWVTTATTATPQVQAAGGIALATMLSSSASPTWHQTEKG